LKPFPYLKKGLAFRLEEGGNVIQKLGRLLGWEIFAKRSLGRASQVVKSWHWSWKAMTSPCLSNRMGKALIGWRHWRLYPFLWCHSSPKMTIYAYWGSPMDILQIALVRKEL